MAFPGLAWARHITEVDPTRLFIADMPPVEIGRKRTICSWVTNPAQKTLAQDRCGGGTHTSSQAVTGADQPPRWDLCQGHASALQERGAAGAGYPAATPRFVAGAPAGWASLEWDEGGGDWEVLVGEPGPEMLTGPLRLPKGSKRRVPRNQLQ